MRRLRLVLVVASAAFLLATSGSVAAKPRTAQLGDQVTGSIGLQSPVEQQTPGFSGPCSDPQLPGWCQPDETQWVVNPTGCIWDHDDFAQLSTSGSLAGNTSYAMTQCFIADWDTHYTGTGHVTGGLVSSSAPLSVTACLSPGQCIPVVASHPSAHVYQYSFCTTAIYYPQDDPALQPISESNGGVGVPTTLTIRATNTSSKTVRDVTVGYTVGDDLNPVSC